MLEMAAVLCFFCAFALLHGAAPGRFPIRRAKQNRSAFQLMRLGTLVALAGGVATWSRAENTTAALLVALAALSVVATAFVLLAPRFPRTLWGLALACPLLIGALLALGGGRG